jgi:hypothetical protein
VTTANAVPQLTILVPTPNEAENVDRCSLSPIQASWSTSLIRVAH